MREDECRAAFERNYRDPHGCRPKFDKDEDGYIYLADEFRNFRSGWDAGIALATERAAFRDDAARLDFLQRWSNKGLCKGMHWDAFKFTTDKSVRDQLDIAIRGEK